MLNEHVSCPDKHTPLTPCKDRARRWGIGACNRNGTIITISPGALTALQWMDWKGRVMVCDICKVCIDTAKHMAKFMPDLRVKAFNLSVQDMTSLFCFADKDPSSLSLVDMDLAFSLPKAMPVLIPTLKTLVDHRLNTTVLLTYVNHRDGMGANANNRRISFLKSHLPSKVKYAGSFNYASAWSDEEHNYSKGSAMSVARLEVKAA